MNTGDEYISSTSTERIEIKLERIARALERIAEKLDGRVTVRPQEGAR